jgi:hypothetical protein
MQGLHTLYCQCFFYDQTGGDIMVETAESSTATAEKTEETATATKETTSIATEGAKTETKTEETAKTETAKTETKAETKTEVKAEVKEEVAKTEVFELEAPKDGLLTKEYVTQFQKDAIEAGLSKDEAKNLLDTQHRAVQDFDSRTKASVEKAKEEWRNMSRADTEIGGDNFNKTAEISKRVVEKFGNDAFKKLLNESGFGNYPEVLRFLSKVGSAFSEDQLKAGNPSSGGTTKSREEILFGGTTPA